MPRRKTMFWFPFFSKSLLFVKRSSKDCYQFLLCFWIVLLLTEYFSDINKWQSVNDRPCVNRGRGKYPIIFLSFFYYHSECDLNILCRRITGLFFVIYFPFYAGIHDKWLSLIEYMVNAWSFRAIKTHNSLYFFDS